MNDGADWDLYYGLWDSTDEGTFTPLSALDYVYRVPEGAVPRKHVIQYDDPYFALLVFQGRNDRPLGFGFHMRANFGVLQQQHSLILTDPTSTRHDAPTYLVDVPAFKIVRAVTDGAFGASYWASARRKETVL